MNGFLIMLKMNMKLMLRNKGYLCFLVILPLCSILLLNIPTKFSYDLKQDTNYKIHELDKEDVNVLNMLNIRMAVKVYDCSQSVFSDYFIQELSNTGSYDIYRIAEKDTSLSEAEALAVESANHNSIGAFIYIPENFDQLILTGSGDTGVALLKGSEDARIDILSTQMEGFLKSLSQFSNISGGKQEVVQKLIAQTETSELEKNTVTVRVGENLNLSKLQQAQSTNIGYSIAIVTMGFLFSGVFIATVVVDEKHNRVYSRILVSNTSLYSYGGVKLLMTVLTTLFQTLIIGIGICLFVTTDFGIPIWSYLYFVFGIGLIFNTISVVAGVLTNDTLTSNYIAFFIWSISAMLAGLYFSIDAAAGWWKKAALLMPQRWFVKSAEMLMAGESGVYTLFAMVTAGFMVIILSAGVLGMKLTSRQ